MYFYESDYRQKREIESHIDLLISQLVKTDIEEQITLPPPDKILNSGDFYIGEVEYLDKKVCPIKLSTMDINRHTGVFGATGSGKTTFVINLIKQFHQKKSLSLFLTGKKVTGTLSDHARAYKFSQ